MRRSSSPPRPRTADERRTDGQSACILLIEDNPGDAGLVREALAEYGVDCDLTVVTDGEKAMDLFDRIDAGHGRCPDLIILDLNLPKRSGHDVLQRIRASSVCASVAVLILTSSNAPKDREEAEVRGATAYVRKPLLLDEFISLGAVFRQMLPS